ncbi:MAG: ribonuclease P protein component [Candidatus Latescibacteria bacterium]|nr:ribonuclease P protein component [Candidatus Latescibacterota bacterium]
MSPAKQPSGADRGRSAHAKRRRMRTLTHAWQFRRCYESGKKLVARHAVIFLHPVDTDEETRVGVVASRKVGGAVKRNRAKRLLRETARRIAPKWTDRHIWVVLVAKASIVEARADEIEADIERALIAGGELDIE